MLNARFFATAVVYIVTVYASLSIFSATASNEDLVWEIIDASGTVAGMEVAASEGLKAAIAPIAQLLEPLGECGVPVLEALEADVASLMTVFTDKALLKPTAELYAEKFSADELRAMLEFYKSPVGIKLKELAPELSLAGVEASQTTMMDVMSSLQAKIQETLATTGAEAQQCMAAKS